MDKPPRLTERQFHRTKRLIRRLCANYDGGNCLLLDNGEVCPCPQLITRSLVCKYFCAAVLPDNRALWAELMTAKPVKRCRICGVPVVSLSNAAKYCPECAARERRRRDRERRRNRPSTSANRGRKSPFATGLQSTNPQGDEDLSTDLKK